MVPRMVRKMGPGRLRHVLHTLDVQKILTFILNKVIDNEGWPEAILDGASEGPADGAAEGSAEVCCCFGCWQLVLAVVVVRVGVGVGSCCRCCADQR